MFVLSKTLSSFSLSLSLFFLSSHTICAPRKLHFCVFTDFAGLTCLCLVFRSDAKKTSHKHCTLLNSHTHKPPSTQHENNTSFYAIFFILSAVSPLFCLTSGQLFFFEKLCSLILSTDRVSCFSFSYLPSLSFSFTQMFSLWTVSTSSLIFKTIRDLLSLSLVFSLFLIISPSFTCVIVCIFTFMSQLSLISLSLSLTHTEHNSQHNSFFSLLLLFSLSILPAFYARYALEDFCEDKPTHFLYLSLSPSPSDTHHLKLAPSLLSFVQVVLILFSRFISLFSLRAL